jgi:hypothetical protein
MKARKTPESQQDHAQFYESFQAPPRRLSGDGVRAIPGHFQTNVGNTVVAGRLLSALPKVIWLRLKWPRAV